MGNISYYHDHRYSYRELLASTGSERQGFGFRRSGFRGLGFRLNLAPQSRFRVEGLGLRVQGFRA